MMENLVQRRVRQCHRVREALHEALVVRDDRLHLSLLQHDLGDPDRVGVVDLPGKVLAAVDVEPREQALGERIRHATARSRYSGTRCCAISSMRSSASPPLERSLRLITMGPMTGGTQNLGSISSR